jgi:hypothetical protein
MLRNLITDKFELLVDFIQISAYDRLNNFEPKNPLVLQSSFIQAWPQQMSAVLTYSKSRMSVK